MLVGTAQLRSLRCAVSGIVGTVVFALKARFPRPIRTDGRTWQDDYNDLTAAQWALLH